MQTLRNENNELHEKIARLEQQVMAAESNELQVRRRLDQTYELIAQYQQHP